MRLECMSCQYCPRYGSIPGKGLFMAGSIRLGRSLFRLGIVANVQIAGAGFENPPLPSLCLWRRFFLQGFQICEVSLAERTPDHVQVKINVLLPAVVEDLEEEAAELFPRGAAEALAPPGCAERVFATLALLEQA